MAKQMRRELAGERIPSGVDLRPPRARREPAVAAAQPEDAARVASARALPDGLARALADARLGHIVLERDTHAATTRAGQPLPLLASREDLPRLDVALRSLGYARTRETETIGTRCYCGYDASTGAWSRLIVTTERWSGALAWPRQILARREQMLRRRQDGERAPADHLRRWSVAALHRLLTPWHRLTSHPGLVVALLGPDGSGKTTLAHGLMQEEPLRARRIYMGTNREAGDALRVARWVARRREAIGDRARGFTWLAIKALGFATHLAEEQYRHALARRHRARGGIVVFDRYALDANVNARLRRAPASWTRRMRDALLHAGACTPDLVLILDAPGEVLYARKGEHSPGRLEQMRRAYAALETECSEVVVIDASQDAGAVCRLVTSLLWARRCSGRATARPPRRGRQP